ncbi:MAG: hypothetical protein PHG08_00860 [Bacilli bacterium]|nr:hypothetical protein [Bacilli bacterium]
MEELEELKLKYDESVQNMFYSSDENFDWLYVLYEEARDAYIECKKASTKRIIKINFY